MSGVIEFLLEALSYGAGAGRPKPGFWTYVEWVLVSLLAIGAIIGFFFIVF